MSEKRSIGSWIERNKGKVAIGIATAGIAASSLKGEHAQPAHTEDTQPAPEGITPDSFNTYQYFQTESNEQPPVEANTHTSAEKNTLSSAELFLQSIDSFDSEHPEAFEQELSAVFEQFFSDLHEDLHTYFNIDLNAATIQFDDESDYLVHGTIELTTTDSSSAQQLLLEVIVLSDTEGLPMLALTMQSGPDSTIVGVSSQEHMFRWITEQIVLPTVEQRLNEQFVDEPDPQARQRLVWENMRDQAEDVLDSDEYPRHILLVWEQLYFEAEHNLTSDTTQ